MERELIAKRIKEIRTENKLSQQAFGALLYVSQDTVSLWEKGRSLPTTENVIAIAKIFEISADFLLGLKEY